MNKTKTYRAILIDPEKCSIDVLDIDGLHQTICQLIGTIGLDHFRIAEHEASWDYGWVDDLGLTKHQPIHAFKFSVRPDPIAGRCVLIGAEKDTGDTCDCKFPIDVLRDNIEWLGLILPEITWDKTDIGERAIVTYAKCHD